ncbi:hypothetical protein O6H91_21G041700 [Diphasiastrum complanatum]|uniref:Uncharacterized protein n=1 Tax=Diphasiastrum complanatum TaxID=34168 RepID=A0ACC2AK57_DIPCM|nr:hypothetical protein O6H91_21G041700 [Diphasiastrum complanatum]
MHAKSLQPDKKDGKLWFNDTFIKRERREDCASDLLFLLLSIVKVNLKLATYHDFSFTTIPFYALELYVDNSYKSFFVQVLHTSQLCNDSWKTFPPNFSLLFAFVYVMLYGKSCL